MQNVQLQLSPSEQKAECARKHVYQYRWHVIINKLYF